MSGRWQPGQFGNPAGRPPGIGGDMKLRAGTAAAEVLRRAGAVVGIAGVIEIASCSWGPTTTRCAEIPCGGGQSKWHRLA